MVINFQSPTTSQAIDDILRPLCIAGTQNVTVTFGPGIYETWGIGDITTAVSHGSHGWFCGSGWKIQGAGRNITTLKIVRKPEVPIQPQSFISYGFNEGTTRVEISDLTVDANGAQLGGNASGFCGRTGGWLSIAHIAVKGAACELPDGAFSIFVNSPNVKARAVSINDVWLSDHQGKAGGIALWGNRHHMPDTWLRANVRNAHIDGAFFGINLFSLFLSNMHDCLITECHYGIFADVGENYQSEVSRNIFHDCARGIHWSGGFNPMAQKCRISHNSFVLAHNNQSGIMLGGHWIAGSIDDNIISSDGTGLTGLRGICYEYSGARHNIVANNIIQSNITNSIPASFGQGRNNTTELGPLPWYLGGMGSI